MMLGDNADAIASVFKDGGPKVIAFAVLVVGAVILCKYVGPIVANLTRLADKLERAVEVAERSELARKDQEAMFGSKLRQADEIIQEAKYILEPFKPKSRSVSANGQHGDER